MLLRSTLHAAAIAHSNLITSYYDAVATLEMTPLIALKTAAAEKGVAIPSDIKSCEKAMKFVKSKGVRTVMRSSHLHRY